MRVDSKRFAKRRMENESQTEKRQNPKVTVESTNRPAKKSSMKLVDVSNGVFSAGYRSASSRALGTPA
jgi:hypothetical protein